MAHNNLAIALAQKGRTAEAEVYSREAVRLEPDSVLFRNNLESFLVQQGKTDEAVEQYNEVLRLDPKNPEAQKDLRRLAFGISP